jgi:hypothetical protein
MTQTITTSAKETIMAAITKIEVNITTGDKGTNGWVYLGVCGREFLLDRTGHNGFKKNTTDQYVLGDANHVFSVANAGQNDPKAPLALDTADLPLFPIYLRLKADNLWHVEGGSIKIFAGGTTETISILAGSRNLFLGPDCGEYLFLRRTAA